MRNQDNETVNPVAGIDTHKRMFNVCVCEHKIVNGQFQPVEHHENFPQTDNGIKRAIRYVQLWNVQRLAIESTSVYHKPVVKGFIKEGFTIYLINAGLIHRGANDEKLDKVDARDLGRLLLLGIIGPNGSIKPSYVPSSEIEIGLRKLTRLRDKISQEETRAKNRIHKLVDQYNLPLHRYIGKSFPKSAIHVLKSIVEYETYPELMERLTNPIDPAKKVHGRLIAAIRKKESTITQFLELAQEQITDTDRIMLNSFLRLMKLYQETMDQLDQRIHRFTEALTPELQRRLKIVRSLPGVGQTLGIRIVVEYGDMARFDNRRKASKYTGLNPTPHKSGGRGDTRPISKKGNKHLRRHLYVASQMAILNDEKWMRYYRQLKKKGRKYRQSMCAIARKLGVLYYDLAKKDELYQRRKHRLKFPHQPDPNLSELIAGD